MPLPKNAKNDEYRALERKAKVAKLYLEGKAQWEIAELVGSTQPTVSKDLAEIREQWQESYKEAFSEKVAVELAKIDKVEAAAWEGWYRSCGDVVTRSKKTEKALRKPKPELSEDEDEPQGMGAPAELVPIKTLIEMTRKGQAGNPSFLAEVRACIDMRLKVLGAYKEPPTAKPQVVLFPWAQIHEPTPITDPVDEAVKQLPPPIPVQATPKGAK